MAQTTGIEWCDSTLNLQMGCDGCELWNPKAGVRRCYAGNLTVLHGGPGKKGWPNGFAEPRIFPERLKQALRWPDLTGKDRPEKPWLNGYPRVIFLNDMGDTFTDTLPIDWLVPHITPMHQSRHIYIILTKRPARMLQCFEAWGETKRCHGEPPVPIPPNFWLLTSVTGPQNVGRIRELLKLRTLGARVLGVSYEPAWGPVDFRPFLGYVRCLGVQGGMVRVGGAEGYLDWLIAGGESGAHARPSHPDWFRQVRDQCQAAGVSFFFKQWGEYAPWKHIRGPILPRQNTVRVVDPQEGGARMTRVGKKAAGALLDGREWREMPLWKR
jgi:protein gp37